MFTSVLIPVMSDAILSVDKSIPGYKSNYDYSFICSETNQRYAFLFGYIV